MTDRVWDGVLDKLDVVRQWVSHANQFDIIDNEEY